MWEAAGRPDLPGISRTALLRARPEMTRTRLKAAIIMEIRGHVGSSAVSFAAAETRELIEQRKMVSALLRCSRQMLEEIG